MGPRSRERGNRDFRNREAGCKLVASMGPRSRERGNIAAEARRKKLAFASMGPRSRERGNRAALGLRDQTITRFNGAALT